MIYQIILFFNWFIDIIKMAPNLWYNKITTSNKPIYRRGANLMINQINQNDHTQKNSNAIMELQIG